MKTYEIQRIAGPGSVVCYVDDPVEHERYKLVHRMLHSPDGFEFGYGGSGPSDLARSILADLLGSDGLDPRMYQDFKFEFIATLEGDGPHKITEKDIREWMEGRK